MKGYAKGFISKEDRDTMKAIVKKADDFWWGFYSHNYVKVEKKKFLFFFTRCVKSYDLDEAIKQAQESHCYIDYMVNNTPSVCYMPYVEVYRKLISLSSSECFYLDHELQLALSQFKKHKGKEYDLC